MVKQDRRSVRSGKEEGMAMRRLLPVRPVFMVFVAALILSVASAGAAFAHGPVSNGQSRSHDGPRGNFGDFLEYDGETVKKQSEKIDYDTHEIRDYIQNVLSDLSDDPEAARERLRKFGPAAQGLVDYLVILDDFMESEGERAPSNVSISSNITLNIAVLMNEDHPDNSIYRYYLVDQFLYSSSFLRIDQRRKHMIVYNHIHRKKNIGVDLTDVEKHMFINSMKFLRNYGFRFRSHYSSFVANLNNIFPSIASDRLYEIELRDKVCGSLTERDCYDALIRHSEAYTGGEATSLLEEFFCRPIVRIKKRYMDFKVC